MDRNEHVVTVRGRIPYGILAKISFSLSDGTHHLQVLDTLAWRILPYCRPFMISHEDQSMAYNPHYIMTDELGTGFLAWLKPHEKQCAMETMRLLDQWCQESTLPENEARAIQTRLMQRPQTVRGPP